MSGSPMRNGSEKSSSAQSPHMSTIQAVSPIMRSGYSPAMQVHEQYSRASPVHDSSAAMKGIESTSTMAAGRPTTRKEGGGMLNAAETHRESPMNAPARHQSSLPSSSMAVDYISGVSYPHGSEAGVSAARGAGEPRKTFASPANGAQSVPKARRTPLDPSTSPHAYLPPMREQYSTSSMDPNEIMIQQRAEELARRKRRHRAEEEFSASNRTASYHPSGASSWQQGQSGHAAYSHNNEPAKPRQSILAALNQSQDLVIKLIEENHLLRKRLEVAITEIHRVRELHRYLPF